MISVSEQVVVNTPNERVVQLRVKDQVTQIRDIATPRIDVIRVGVQGPVSALAQSVQQQAQKAEQAAKQATQVANEALTGLGDLLDQLNQSLDFHGGAISAMKES